ncbi:hypothetical protein B4166_2137 [Caldibacillus thermoamylovorans]|nr:hypothetical protein B4166_2137 [Caldibacillus thermoamylovorans]
MIMFENVSKRYEDGTVAVNSLNLEIKQGEFFFFYRAEWLWKNNNTEND